MVANFRCFPFCRNTSRSDFKFYADRLVNIFDKYRHKVDALVDMHEVAVRVVVKLVTVHACIVNDSVVVF